MASLTREEIDTVFNKFDLNMDGEISSSELYKAMKHLGLKPTKLDVKKLIKEADKDGNGKVSYNEFLKFMGATPKKKHALKDLEAQFKMFDADGDGEIVIDEMKRVVVSLGLKGYSLEVIEDVFREADVNNDGRITFLEFVSAMG